MDARVCCCLQEGGEGDRELKVDILIPFSLLASGKCAMEINLDQTKEDTSGIFQKTRFHR